MVDEFARRWHVECHAKSFREHEYNTAHGNISIPTAGTNKHVPTRQTHRATHTTNTHIRNAIIDDYAVYYSCSNAVDYKDDDNDDDLCYAADDYNE